MHALTGGWLDLLSGFGANDHGHGRKELRMINERSLVFCVAVSHPEHNGRYIAQHLTVNRPKRLYSWTPKCSVASISMMLMNDRRIPQIQLYKLEYYITQSVYSSAQDEKRRVYSKSHTSSSWLSTSVGSLLVTCSTFGQKIR